LPAANSKISPSDSPPLHHSVTPILLIEGAGGLLAPLGEPSLKVRSSQKRGSSVYSALDLVKALRCEVIVAAPNQLGVINHTLLTMRALKDADIRRITGVVINIHATRRAAPDTRYNVAILAELLEKVPVFSIPHIGFAPKSGRSIRESATTLRETLRRVLLP
jgi:dethiobiotin synthetase